MILDELLDSIVKYSKNNAFCIDEQFYTYEQLLKRINAIRYIISINIAENDKNISIIANDDLDTYASIIALWFEGKTYVPLLNYAPEDRNSQVINQANVNFVLASKPFKQNLPASVLVTSEQADVIETVPVKNEDENLNAYILFTSGSTGQPKGVPITLGCVSSLIKAVEEAGDDINEHDRVLQMFELTFDLSVVSYLHPLLRGACVYTIPEGEVKNLYIMDLMEFHQLTVMLMVPSIIILLRPHYKDIVGESVRLCSFCGEALPLDVTNEWRKCVPNARIRNYYGPTEDTVYCTYYDVDDEHQKNHNGSICIGVPLSSGSCIIVNSENQEVPAGDKGELCLAGNQLTPGYWNNPEKNVESFFMLNGTRYYRTGDLCYADKDGDIQYIGRLDFQTKINGFRVELSEIEHYACEALNNEKTCICVAFVNKINTTEIGLVVDSKEPVDETAVLAYIANHLPSYEVPTQIKVLTQLPLNINGKIDRKQIKLYFEKC